MEKKKELENLAGESELAIANGVAVRAMTIICSIISLAYIAEIFKHSRTVLYVAVTVILCMAPVILGWIAYSRQKDSQLVKHIVAAGYAVMYCYVLFTTVNSLVFTYVIPMLIIVTLYGELKYTIMIGTGVIVVNIAEIILKFVTTEVPKSEYATYEIQGLVIVLIVCYFIWVSSASARFEKIRMARLKLEQMKTAALLDNILSVSGRMTENASQISVQMNSLRSSVDQTLTSMGEVNDGTSESADAVQNQLQMTEDIQNYIVRVQEAAQTINDNIQTMSGEVQKGQESINRMGRLTEEVDNAGNDVAKALASFQETTSQMNTITELINNVASQTSLLSLNASIEAARAGEAGRGFAVVASEISNLAGQTSDATRDIDNLIENITSQLDTIVSRINQLLETGREESRCAEETTQNFQTISENVDEITAQSGDLNSVVLELQNANSEIVNTIQTISAITEQVTAHANATYASSEENQEIVSRIDVLVEGLNADAKELKSNEAQD